MVKFEGMGYKKEMLKGVGIATQRETTILWDRKTGKPLYNASAYSSTPYDASSSGV
jgi:glycerol kinase